MEEPHGASGASGPLAGIRVVELAGMGPAPHAATVLSDLGADVVMVERLGAAAGRGGSELPLTGRRRVEVDLKTAEGCDSVLALAARADVLIEGFRPGVTERLGIGPEQCASRNPALIYARVTGWGQSGPLAERAGHDINYLALTGVLHAVGRADQPPVVPLNLIGDYGGGSMYLVAGVLAALVERSRTGLGQVVDAAIVDGVCNLSSALWGLRAAGRWTDDRGRNRLDTGAPFYDVYGTADGRYMAVGALEAPFYAELLAGLGLDPSTLPDRDDRTHWPELRGLLAAAFATRTRDEWTATFDAVDACVTPVLRFDEVARHPHMAARANLVDPGGWPRPAPAPRFSRTPPPVPRPAPTIPDALAAVLAGWGDPEETP